MRDTHSSAGVSVASSVVIHLASVGRGAVGSGCVPRNGETSTRLPSSIASDLDDLTLPKPSARADLLEAAVADELARDLVLARSRLDSGGLIDPIEFRSLLRLIDAMLAWCNVAMVSNDNC